MLDAFKKCRKKTQILRVEKGGFPSLDNTECYSRTENAGSGLEAQGFEHGLTDGKKPCSFVVA